MLARRLIRAVLFVAPLGGWTGPILAQARTDAPSSAWNDARTLTLVQRARAARQSASVDSTLRTYRSQARGYVYFFVDRPDSEEHVLVKADQVALDLYWQAPRDTKQRIVGQRDEEVLPTRIRYHLDHLTVVQDDFGDRIRLGDGDEVEAVTHPMAPGADRVYDYQVVDSLTLLYGADGEEVRVYEIQVRPKRLDRPGFVGTVFVDRATAAIVRMNFSFTPASYVDAYLDYIRISLDNSLWMGRHWLPYRQEVELRREMPILDFSAGSVIRSRFEIRDYEFNVELAQSLFRGTRVSAVSPAQRAAFSFERGLFDEIDEEGLTVSTTMEEVRVQVREVVENEVLSGLAPIRLHLDGLSDFARYNRAEGVYLGGGLTLRPRGDLRLRAAGGYAFGRRRPSGSLVVMGEAGRLGPNARAYWDEVGDVGGNPGASPILLNTISAASGSQDFLDPFFRRGGTLTLGSGGAPGVSLSVSWEEHRSAEDVVSDGPDTEFRPVRSVHEGTFAAAALSARGTVPGGGDGRLTMTAGRLERRSLASAVGEVDWRIGAERASLFGTISAEAGVTNPGAPAQSMFMIGGRHTLPGQEYRAFLGNGYWLVRGIGTVPIRPPYVGIRALGVAGATYLGAVDLPSDWPLVDSGGIRGSVGLGLSIAWDTVFMDVAHGVRGGSWEAVVSVSQRFEGWM